MGAGLLRLDLLGQAAPCHARGGAGGGATAAGGVPCGADEAAAGAGLQLGAAENAMVLDFTDWLDRFLGKAC